MLAYKTFHARAAFVAQIVFPFLFLLRINFPQEKNTLFFFLGKRTFQVEKIFKKDFDSSLACKTACPKASAPRRTPPS